MTVLLLLRTYLKVRKLAIRTNLASFKWLLNLSDSPVMPTPWQFCILEFHFDIIIYKIRIQNQAVDEPPSLTAETKYSININDDLPVPIIDHSEYKFEAKISSLYIECLMCAHREPVPGIITPGVKLFLHNVTKSRTFHQHYLILWAPMMETEMTGSALPICVFSIQNSTYTIMNSWEDDTPRTVIYKLSCQNHSEHISCT